MNIIFVCTGNTCRSPLAEGLANKYVKESGISDIHFTSRGISVIPSSEVSENSVIVAKEYGVSIEKHIPESLKIDEALNSDYIFTMTQYQSDIIKNAVPEVSDKVFSISEFAEVPDIKDPYGGNLEVYRICGHEIYEAIKIIIQKLYD